MREQFTSKDEIEQSDLPKKLGSATGYDLKPKMTELNQSFSNEQERAEEAYQLLTDFYNDYWDQVANQHEDKEASPSEITNLANTLKNLLPLLESVKDTIAFEYQKWDDKISILLDAYKALDYPEVQEVFMEYFNNYRPNYNEFTGGISYFNDYEYQIILLHGSEGAKNRVKEEMRNFDFEFISPEFSLFQKAFVGLIKDRDPETDNFVRSMFENLNNSTIYRLCYNCMLTDDPEITEDAINVFEEYAGINLDQECWDKLIQSWNESIQRRLLPAKKTIESKLDHKTCGLEYNNLNNIRKIFKKNYKAVPKLINEYGIRFFGRYVPEMLLDCAIPKKGDTRPAWLAIYPYSDHNGAFYMNQSFDIYDQTTEKYRPQVYECQGKIGLIRALRKNLAQNGPAAFAIIGGHGSEYTIQFGDRNSDVGNLLVEDFTDGNSSKRASKYFKDDATIILESCSTGAKGGIGQFINEKLGIRVIAPTIPSHIRQIVYHDDGKDGKTPKFKVNFSSKTGENPAAIYDKKLLDKD